MVDIFYKIEMLIVIVLILAVTMCLLGGACWIAFFIWQHVFAFFI